MLSGFQVALLDWYDHHKRDLPWRQTRDPYAIWVSEIMLQQTRVETVLPYWMRWMDAFPTVQDLANAEEEKVLSLWQGLGYYQRGKRLREGALHISNEGVPTSATEWLTIPGVGRYTASAIASIAYDEAVPLVDGNVERVVARLTANRDTGSALHRAAWEWAERWLHPDRPGDWNQALMELGATVCTPMRPLCGECPVRDACQALKQGVQNEIPAPKEKPEPVDLQHELFVPLCQGKVGLKQNEAGEWWAGLWAFPRTEPGETPEYIDRNALEPLGQISHVVTHHRITVTCHIARLVKPTRKLKWFKTEDLEALPVPSTERKLLKKLTTRTSGLFPDLL